jgi:hypothetical protein
MRQNVLTAVNDIPAPPPMKDVLRTKRQTVATVENQILADRSSRTLLTKTHQRRHEATLKGLAVVTDLSEAALLEATTELHWLRTPRPEQKDDAPDERLDLAPFNARAPRHLAVLRQGSRTHCLWPV